MPGYHYKYHQRKVNQPGCQTLQQLENLLIKAAKGEDYSAEFCFTMENYRGDILQGRYRRI